MSSPHYWRKATIVEPGVQWRFALQLLAAQLVSTLVFLVSLQAKISGLIQATPSLQIELALRDAFSQALMAFLIVTPIIGAFIVLVALRLSGQFMGPVPRLRRGMRDLADGTGQPTLVFRPGDALEGVDSEFNRLAERVCALEEELSAQSHLESSPEPPRVNVPS